MTTPQAPDRAATPRRAGTTGASAAPRRPRGREERSRAASLALHSALIAATVIALFPIVFIVLVSIRGENGWTHPMEMEGFTLSNYTHVLGGTEFLTWMLNSVVIAGGTMLVGVLISASAGYALSRMRFPGHAPLMWTFLVCQMFPVAVLIVPLYNILGALGLLDSYGGLIITYCSVSVPFCAWMLKGYFDTIPTEIDESGRVDGLSPFGTFWRLVVPLARPGLAVTAFYTFLTAWGEVAFATQFMSSETKYTLAVGLQTFVGPHRAEWGLITASSVLIMVPAALLFFFAQRHLVAGLTAGGTKG
ncbi:ABC transporter permease subunit [Streptomyces clavuligerus]|uniref:sugar ABC transporter permease n=1 Tax=Streptomyces clavuligerus TaxID=1901 RepID=UPI000810DB15|nr:ABC transporter permease subunit [Streptomyces clavuligerus]ANW20492.1 ABC transporter permease [Streptomyces clavuligerus]AXU15119.1 ABC transporter permease subunit [Streptomyces clavuligerus]QPL65120.1 ABC transporter permease subunit [Streptomyces clavuligerus]QPL71151.1 ABC transporter permease subunit [Streptomyces clavuligerus]QPL77234.1 ABC transporter permease subunit [Streptomyces clavuligerus]